jgi:hypothetical protein
MIVTTDSIMNRIPINPFLFRKMSADRTIKIIVDVIIIADNKL